ncbi:hypothetical protein [Cohnella nanjingensis]|uniref:RNA polymerase subunit sigma n=1 Tax=Cohnella nanjingensis TaxID=1387779 RepID=A0A7X0RXM5_9BACL|nr:hypothetical protein [Cohnella nanjingensis]MBB6675538.1 hypothetical protein [Cohnella nanjingensis]
MSFKPLDLQTSIPRSVELTQLHQQQQQRPALEQAALGEQAMKRAERQAQQKTKTEGAAGRNISEREPKEGQRRPKAPSAREDGGDDEAKPQVNGTEHPFKGRHIDLTL